MEAVVFPNCGSLEICPRINWPALPLTSLPRRGTSESGVVNVEATTSKEVSNVMILSMAGRRPAPISVPLILVQFEKKAIEKTKTRTFNKLRYLTYYNLTFPD